MPNDSKILGCLRCQYLTFRSITVSSRTNLKTRLQIPSPTIRTSTIVMNSSVGASKRLSRPDNRAKRRKKAFATTEVIFKMTFMFCLKGKMRSRGCSLHRCPTEKNVLLMNWEVIWQASDSSLPKELHGLGMRPQTVYDNTFT